mmetsp:Transcript_18087/g.22142  ORF Transcript_18087/g.22142 Transcript_18087/m.22142 type:complete len:317 (-) Transcript_18087:102-1052(-)
MFVKSIFLLFTSSIFASVHCFTPTVNFHHDSTARQAVNTEGIEEDISTTSSRRGFFQVAGSSILATVALTSKPDLSLAASGDYSGKKVLVLGGSGFVGSEICKQLKVLGIDYIATSRDGRGDTVALDFTNPNVNIAKEVEQLTAGCSAVISSIGAIGTSDDQVVNSGTGIASLGAKSAGVKNFVYISVAPEVRASAQNVSFLEKYMTGKTFSEDSIKSSFANGEYTLIEPTFIYGGDKFAITPPRVADGYGKLVEGVLSTGPFRAVASIAPGIIGVALEPPVKVRAVASAAVAGALGLTQSTLDSYDKINEAAKLI